MKRAVVISLVFTLLISLSACSPAPTSPSSTGQQQLALRQVTSPDYPAGIDFDDFEARRTIRQENPVSLDGLNAIQSFAYQTGTSILGSVPVNGCYSPLSLYYALSLAGTGAEGLTRDELFSLLGVSDADQLSLDLSHLYRVLFAKNKVNQLKIANSIWFDPDYQGEAVSYKDSFLRNGTNRFFSELFEVDFAQPQAGEAMAKWIADQTDGTLQPTFSPDPEQILSLINTIYFKDEWVDRFDAVKTKPDVFHLADGRDVTCDFMNMTYVSHGFDRGDGFIRSALGLKSGAQMVFVLPDKGVDLGKLLSSPDHLRNLLEGGQHANGKVIWKVPKFSHDSTFDLIDPLKKLGVQEAFRQNADFSGITDHMAFISGVTQQTHVAIDENGVVASAFTKIDYAGSAMPVDEAEMILDRPFLYAIFSPPVPLTEMSGQSQTASPPSVPLFIGVCGNPVD